MTERLSAAQSVWRARHQQHIHAYSERTISISTAAASGYEVLIESRTEAPGAHYAGDERKPASDAASAQLLFEAEAIKLLLGGYDVGLAADPDSSARRTDLALPQTSLPEWRPLPQAGGEWPGHRLREMTPHYVRMWLQLTANGMLSLISIGTAVAPKTLVSAKSWRLFGTLSEWIATRREKYLAHLLLEVMLPITEAAGAVLWIDLLAYEGQDVRNQPAAYRLALAEQTLSEVGPALKLLLRPLEEASPDSRLVLAQPTDSHYGKPLLLLGGS